MRISMKEIWRNLDGPPKNKELWTYVVNFEFSRPKSSSFIIIVSRSSQCSTTGGTKAVVCAILSVGWCI